MKQLTMRTHNHIRRLIAAALAIIMALSLSVSAFAVEYNTCDPGCPVCNPGNSQNSRRSAISDALAAVLSFSDVPGTHTFHDAIIWCANKSIVNGYSDSTFRPANTVSRSNFTVMLSRAFYADDVAKYSTESNLKYGAFMPNYVALNYNGILKNTSFSEISDLMSTTVMNKGISRYDMAQLMTNIMTKSGFSASTSDKNNAIKKITDYSSIPSQYRDAVSNVYALGIITGYADGSFGGDVTMNRGQAAVVIYRMMQYTGATGTEKPTPDPEAPVDPDTGEIACSCVTLTGECKCCNTTETAGKPSNPDTPSTPNTPSQNGKTLVDGSAITEANVMRLMEAKIAEWGNKTWGANANDTTPYPIGNTGDVRKIVNQYIAYGTTSTRVSCSGGCGGWATYLSDAAFGSTGFPLRKTTVENVRAGDIVIDLIDGKISHISIASGKTNVRDFGSYTVTNHGEYTANAGQVPGHSPNGIDPTKAAFTTNYDSNTGVSRVIYTRYPA